MPWRHIAATVGVSFALRSLGRTRLAIGAISVCIAARPPNFGREKDLLHFLCIGLFVCIFEILRGDPRRGSVGRLAKRWTGAVMAIAFGQPGFFSPWPQTWCPSDKRLCGPERACLETLGDHARESVAAQEERSIVARSKVRCSNWYSASGRVDRIEFATSRSAALRGLDRANVADGSKADLTPSLGHVRFAPESRRYSPPSACPLSANNGHREQIHSAAS
jgi:hypothetical protein